MDVGNIGAVRNSVRVIVGRAQRGVSAIARFRTRRRLPNINIADASDEVPTLLQIGIHRAPGNWPSLPTLAFLGLLKHFLESRASIGVGEDFSATLDHGLFDDFGHDAEIMERVHPWNAKPRAG